MAINKNIMEGMKLANADSLSPNLDAFEDGNVQKVEVPKGKVSQRYIPGQRRTYTAKQLQEVAAQFIEAVEEQFVEIQVAKTNPITGEALTILKPLPPMVEMFCKFASINYKTFLNYKNASISLKDKGYSQEDIDLYEAVAEDVQEFCNTQIKKDAMLGNVNQQAAEFYLINRSDMDKKKVVEFTMKEINRPAWMDGISKDLKMLPKDGNLIMAEEAKVIDDDKEEKKDDEEKDDDDSEE